MVIGSVLHQAVQAPRLAYTRAPSVRQQRATLRVLASGGTAKTAKPSLVRSLVQSFSRLLQKTGVPLPFVRKMAQAHEFTNAGLNIDVRPESYDAELAVKVDKVRETMASAGLTIPDELDVYKSAPSHFRMRTEFSIWHDRESKPPRCYYAMFDKQQGKLPNGKFKAVEVTSFPMGSRRINELMPRILEAVHANEALMTRLFQINFLTTLSGEALVTMIYHTKLGEPWMGAAMKLKEELNLQGVIGRSKKQRVVCGQDFVIEKLNIDGKVIEYKQLEGSFSQPNAGMAQNMLTWAKAAATRRGEAVQPASARAGAGGDGDAGAGSPGGSPSAKRARTSASAAEGSAGPSSAAPPGPPTDDFLELYCGSGAFTAALAPLFRQCVATEISKPAVASARENMRRNGIGNVFLAPLSAEEFAEAYAGKRAFERLKGTDLSAMDVRCVLVDPPRAGCGPDVMKILQQFPAIVYISCNPGTMAQDMAGLGPSHRIAKFAVFDQFPYTPHAECGALLLATGLGPAPGAGAAAGVGGGEGGEEGRSGGHAAAAEGASGGEAAAAGSAEGSPGP